MRYAASLLMAVTLCGVPFFAGCDKTVSETKSVKENSDGGTKTQDKKVTENSDGTMTKTTETKTSNP